MMVTLHLTDGRKITKERDKLIIMRPQSKFAPDVQEGCITVNWCNVIYMRKAEQEEIEHWRTHGW